jgi:hypothetical protein
MEDNVRRNSRVVYFSLIILILSACSNEDKNRLEERDDASTESIGTTIGQTNDYEARILNVDTDLEKEHVWHFVPEGVTTMTISAEAENVDTVLFWITETGTGTWADRTLIGYDIDGSDGWSVTWDFGDRIFLDHITIQALGSDSATQATEFINLRSRSAE